jgi:hypothetical protein
MTTLRRGAEHLPAPHARFDARTVSIALAAALAITLTALIIVIGTSRSGTEPIRVAPTSSGPIPPSAAERHQPPGLNGPGMQRR